MLEIIYMLRKCEKIESQKVFLNALMLLMRITEVKYWSFSLLYYCHSIFFLHKRNNGWKPSFRAQMSTCHYSGRHCCIQRWKQNDGKIISWSLHKRIFLRVGLLSEEELWSCVVWWKIVLRGILHSWKHLSFSVR